MHSSRRTVLSSLGLAGLGAAIPATARKAMAAVAPEDSCPFRLAVINDEISQDFEHACHVAAVDFGLHWIELRSMWNTSITALSPQQVGEAQKILAKYKLRVTDIASPLYKSFWPGAPRSQHSEINGNFHADYDAHEQDRLLESCVAMAKAFQTDRVRCFDFWRIDDQKPFRAAINRKLQQAAERCAKDNIVLLLENEMECNTATGEEAAAVLKAVPNHNFMLNWDPGNAAAVYSKPFPNGYDLLPKHRIGHCHCKDVVYKPDHKYAWAPVGGGVVDWVGQLRALKRDGFHYALSLETHWRGAGTPEASSRISMAGLKKTLGEAGIHCSGS
jgi:L-ribulose-5-phosphate 3-epimerase